MSPKKNPSAPVTMVALLRGINVGGKHSLPMKQLDGDLCRSQMRDVRTYIQSGNVIFSAATAVIEGISDVHLPRRLNSASASPSPVILRTAEQMAQAVRDNPFLSAGLPEKTLYVVLPCRSANRGRHQES